MENLQDLAVRVQAALTKGVESYFEAGRALSEARNLTPKPGGQSWADWVNENTGISVAYAGQLIKIAGHPVLAELWDTKPERLPRTFDALYLLACAPADKLAGQLDLVRPGMSRGEASDLARKLSGKPVKPRQPHASARELQHQLDAAVARLSELEGDFDAVVKREVETRLDEIADNRVADAVAEVIDPTIGNPELAVLGAVEAYHHNPELDWCVWYRNGETLGGNFKSPPGGKYDQWHRIVREMWLKLPEDYRKEHPL